MTKPTVPNNPPVLKGCAVLDCTAKFYSLSFCKNHYAKFKKYGNPSYVKEYPKHCLVKGCHHKRDARGWCSTHYARWRKHGSPDVVKQGGSKKAPRVKAVYAIVNRVNGQRYIGSTAHFNLRKSQHLTALRHNHHYRSNLQADWDIFGEHAFEVVVLEIINESLLLLEREQWWLDNTPLRYNISPTAGNNRGVRGFRHSKETREKMSAKCWMRTRGYTDEQRKKRSEAQKQLFANGYKHPRNKTVLQCTLEGKIIKQWESISLAARELGGHNSLIVKCLKGQRSTSLGFTWRYA